MCDMNIYGNGGNIYVYEIANWKMWVVRFLLIKSCKLEIVLMQVSLLVIN